MKQYKRNRILYGAILIVVIFVGLYSRSTYPFPLFLKLYAGDVLWSVMVYLLLCLCMPKTLGTKLFIATLFFSFSIECTQLLTLDWLVYLRTTPLHYILGQGFVWSDLLSYCIGSFMGFAVDRVLYFLQKKRGESPLINHVQ